VNGRQALFPSSYVQKIQPSTPASAPTPAARTNKPVYKPFGAAHHGADAPPPPGGAGVNSVGLQQDPGTEEKKSKFGKYGNTVSSRSLRPITLFTPWCFRWHTQLLVVSVSVPVRVIFVPIRPWNPVLMVSVMARRGNWGRIGAGYFLILPWSFSAIIPTHIDLFIPFIWIPSVFHPCHAMLRMTICGHCIFIFARLRRSQLVLQIE
jgi:hypothetical protein